ncbi:MAG: hypothetical protein AAF547_02900 [Actinomycetota bacterium]
MDVRQISPVELEVMRAWLAHDVPGAESLRNQIGEDTGVFRSCDCGCASIGFLDLLDSPAQGVSIFEIDAEIVDENGASIGGMMLTIRNGRLHDVDVHSWFDDFPFPSIEQVRWHQRNQQGG